MKSSAQLYSRALPWGVRKFTLPLILPMLLSGAMLPQFVGPYQRVSSETIVPANQNVWKEYGLEAGERVNFEKDGKKLVVEVYRLQDSTGALAAWQWLRPADSHPADAKIQELTKLAAVSGSREALALGNHLVILDGYLPTQEEAANIFRSLPHQQSGPLPTLPDHVPDPNLIRGSERYITGPAALALFLPEVNSAAAGFHLGTEVQLASFRQKAGILKLAIFSFPTLDSARDHAAQLSNIPKSIVKRSGPLVAVVFNPGDLNSAESLLSLIHYQAVVTSQDRSDRPPTKKDNWGNFMVNVFILIGILLAFCLVSGLVFGAVRASFRRGGASGEGEEVISLHLNNR